MKSERKVSFKKEPKKMNTAIIYRVLYIINILALLGTIVAVVLAITTSRVNYKKVINEVTIPGDLSAVKSNVALRSGVEYKGVTYKITWASSDERYVTKAGRVIRPKHNESDVNVKLTASLVDDLNYTKTFDLKILKTDSIYEDALQTVDIPYIENLDSNYVLQPSVSYLGIDYKLNWESANEGAVTILDTVPGRDTFIASPILNVGGSVEAKLVASITIEEELKAEREFPLTVRGRGFGTKELPYLVYEQSHFDLMKTASSANYKLMRDISIANMTPMTTFNGVLDGNGFEIAFSGKNEGRLCTGTTDTMCYGMFLTINGATFKDLMISNTQGVSEKSALASNFKIHYGLLAAISSGNSTLTNITLKGNLTLTAETTHISGTAVKFNAGGLIGTASANTKIISSRSSLTFKVESKVQHTRMGGFIGEGTGITIDKSSVTGSTELSAILANVSTPITISSGTGYVGGFVGELTSGTASTISESFAKGSIISSTDNTSINAFDYHAGGFVAKSSNLKVNDSYVTATISVAAKAGVATATADTSERVYVGGIVGYALTTTITNVYSTASVSYTVPKSATGVFVYAYVGGVIGCHESGQINLTFSMVAPSPAASVTSSRGHDYYIGGVAGYSNTSVTYDRTWQRFYPSSSDGSNLCFETNNTGNNSYYSKSDSGCRQLDAANATIKRFGRITYNEPALKENIHGSYQFAESIWDASGIRFVTPSNYYTSAYVGPKLINNMEA